MQISLNKIQIIIKLYVLIRRKHNKNILTNQNGFLITITATKKTYKFL